MSSAYMVAFRQLVLAATGSPAPPVSFARFPRNTSGERIRLMQINEIALPALDGNAQPLIQSDIQCNVIASTYERTIELSDALRAALHGYTSPTFNGIFLENTRDFNPTIDETDSEFMRQLDFALTYRAD